MVAAVSNTAYGIIADAYRDAGLIGRTSIPDSEQLAEGLRRLCDIVNLEQTQGLKLFLIKDQSIDLVEDQVDYVLGPGGDVDMTKPLMAVQGYVLNTSSIRRPLVMLSWNEWMLLSQVTGNSGTISSFMVNKQATYLEVKVWNPPDATEAANTLHLLIEQQAENPVNLQDDMSFPQEWRIFLRWALADDLSTGQPESVQQRCSSKAEYYRKLLGDWDVEDASTFFTPSSQAMNQGGSFV